MYRINKGDGRHRMVEVLPRGSRVPDLVELGKPRIVLMVLLSVAAGFWMAGPSNHAALVLFHTLLGTASVAAGTNALNQVINITGYDANGRWWNAASMRSCCGRVRDRCRRGD